MGFKGMKNQLLDCLEKGCVLHQERFDIDVKNLMAIGQVTLEEVAGIVARAGEADYSARPHHQVKGVVVHIIKSW